MQEEIRVKKLQSTMKNSIFIILIIVLFLSSAASAATVTYRYLPSTGATVATGVTTNFNCPTTYPTTYSIALLTTSSSGGCGATRQYGDNLDPALDTFYNTAYSENTQVTGNWVFGRMRDGSTGGGTFTFRLIYIYPNGTIVTLPGTPATQYVGGGSSADYNVSLSGMSGVVPSGAKLGLRVSLTGTSTQLRWYVGDTAATAGNASGIFAVTETPAGGASPTYNISGYITNKSSGVPLNGATVQTNTSLSTTTNSQGYYIFSGLSNRTYIINATLTGYAVNSTTTTISGANKTNVNISLSPVPTYILSGYVKNSSNGAAISGATVTTNTTLSTSTNGAGYYSFTVGNGTYIITASSTGYSDNSITRTVNGAAVSNANISLTPVPLSIIGKIFVATNRYVILDDPIYNGKTAQTADNFDLPFSNTWTTNNLWSGNQTNITGYALLLDMNGVPIKDTSVNFTIRNWNGLDSTNLTSNTNSNGIANFTFSMNNETYYGRWYVDARASDKSDSTGFIYNWWGCQSGGTCGYSHGNTRTITVNSSKQNSPYTLGRETITSNGNHNWAANDKTCVGCHRSYSGVGGGNTFDGQSNKTSDVHKTNTCVTCHSTETVHDTDAVIKSCSDCHSFANLTKEYTMNGSPLRSNYSGMVAASGHNPNSTILCIICHGPFHNITKPDETSRFINDNITEDSQCLTCHITYNKHKGSVNCTLCHSQDIHTIQIFSQSARYVNKGNTYQGNCTNCHQNASFLNALKSAPKAGSYPGPNAPQVQNPLNHSNDILAGKKWNDSYWINGTNGTAQLSSCVYCHGSTQHSLSALGKPYLFKGNNVVNSTISTTTSWCASCHWQGYTNGTKSYMDMVNAFLPLLVPPEITGDPAYGAQGKPGFYNHSGFAMNDENCESCHGSLSSSTSITGLMHNVAKGTAGGVNCTSCHNIGGDAKHDVDIANMGNGAHANLNNRSQYTGGNITNRKCWACHGTLNANGFANESNQPVGSHNTSMYKNPRGCSNCHNNTQSLSNFSAPQVIEHREGALVIKTTGTSCSLCHNNSLTPISETDGFGITNSRNATSSHYLKDATSNLMTPTNHSKDCTWCHITNTNNASWGTPVNPNINFSILHTGKVNSDCTNCHGNFNPNTVKLHNSGITSGQAGGVNCTSCHDIGGSSGHDVDISSMNIGAHSNLNNKSQYTGGNITNRKCWACHGTLNSNGYANESNQPATDHNQSIFRTPRTCSDCHTNLQSLSNFSAPQVIEHREGAPVITTPGTSCSLCHNNSLTPISETDGFGITNSRNATSSHYLKDATSNLMTPTNHSKDCTWCHITNTNNASWGTPVNPNINFSILHTGKVNSDCTNCHGNFNPNTVKLHNSGITSGQAGGVNCTSCHDIGGSSGHDVDISSMNIGAHSNLNNKSQYTGGNITNRKCWACHGTLNSNGYANESNQPATDHNQSIFRTPRTCSDCHTNLQSLSNFSAPQVIEHREGAPVITTPGTSCSLCHNNSLTPISETDGFGITNSRNATSSHYLKDATSNLMTPTNHSKDCTWCHITNTNNASWGTPVNPNINFSILHTGKVNSDCTNCHGNFNPNTVKLHNSGITSGQAGGVNCTSCHDIGGSSGHDVDISSMNIGAHSNLNNKSQYTGGNITNRKCWACHGTLNSNGYANESNQPATDHNQSIFRTPRTCSDCHTNLQSLSNFSAPQVIEHREGALVIKTTGTSCSLCHNNSLTPISETDGFGITNSRNATSSHYLKDATSNLMTPTNHSKDCTWCHITNTNNASWGTPVNPNINFSILHTGKVNSDCTNCHGNFNPNTVKLHNSGITSGQAGGVNCTSCHDIGGSSGHDVDISSMNIGAHSNLNNKSQYTGGNITNRKCWACHGTLNSNGYANESNQPATDHNQSIFRTPRTCSDCHTNLQSLSNFSAPQVIEHREGAPVITTPGTSCSLCHNNSLTPISETDGFGITNSRNATSSHYLKDATSNLMTPTNHSKDCTWCHITNTNNASWGTPVNPNINFSILHTGKVNSDCTNCHGNFNPNTVKLHNSGITSGQAGGVNCTSCHDIGGSSGHDVDISSMNIGAHSNLNNKSQYTGGNITNRKCWACHGTLNSNGYANESNQPATDHNQSIFRTPRTCADCHTNLQSLSNFSAPQVIEHREGAPVITTPGTSCSLCHNNSLTPISETDGFGITNSRNATSSHYLKDATSNLMTPTNHSKDCTWCHITNTNNASWGTPVNPNINFSILHTGKVNSDCTNCHGNFNPNTVKLHNSGITPGQAGGVNCTSCHDIGGSSGHDVDISSMNIGAHSNLNNKSQYTGGNITNRKCWACHGTLNSNGYANESNQPATDHNQSIFRTPRTCADCHTNLQSLSNFSAPQVIEHREGAPVITTPGTSCSLCHNNSLTSISETDGFGITNSRNATSSHYLKDATSNLMTPTNHSKDCTWCHITNTNNASWGTPVNPNINFSILHTGKVNSDCTNCHGNFNPNTVKLHNSGITSGQAGGVNCTSCHDIGGSSGHDVDISSMNIGAHSNLNNKSQYTGGNITNRKCWACHGTLNSNGYANESNQPATDHNQSIFRTPRTCADCHTNLQSLSNFSAPQVIEHREGAPVITTPGTSCSLCHNNSLTPISETDGFGITNSRNATSSHYLKDATSNLMTPTNHSKDCTWCHITNTNNASWGTPVNPNINFSILHTGKVNSDCTNCHGNFNPNTVKLHNSGITPGQAGGVNCTSCHDIGGSSGHDVDISSMNIGAHSNLNNKSQYTGGNITNRKCWACHGTLNSNGYANESNQPATDHNQSIFRTPRTCSDCHTNLQSLSNFSAPQVIEHREGAPVITTPGTSCSLCHNNSLTPISETDGFGITNSRNATSSHYLKDATSNLMTPTNHSKDCTWCHITNTNNASWGTPVNPNINFSILHTGKVNSDCTNCHGNFNPNTVKLHNSGITPGQAGGVNCTSCHDIGGSSGHDVDISSMNIGAHSNLNNKSQYTGGNITNRKCWACHGTLNSNGYANESNQPATDHNQSIFRTPRTCADCHTNLQSISNFSAPQVIEHREGAPVIQTSGTLCSLCHNNSLTSITETDGFGILSAQNATASHYLKDANINLMTTSNHSNDCRYCHITNNLSTIWGTPFNPKNSSKFAHSDENVAQNESCYTCHGGLTSSVKLHDTGITSGSGTNCIVCHTQDQRGYAAINLSLFTKHSNVNTTGGQDNITNDDCTTCHYNFNYDVMNETGFTTPTKACTDCHIDGSYQAPIISDHIPPKMAMTPGGKITTGAYCSTCHNNSINEYNFSVNSSSAHYGTNSSLLKPTVNTSSVPVNGFMNPSDAEAYNKPCNNCHNPANTSYGVITSITNAHTSQGTCNECHVNTDADNLHNNSLGMPATFTCKECHTTYAGQYKAPNLTNTNHKNNFYDCTSTCHGTDYGTPGEFDAQDHNVDRKYTTYSNIPTTDVVSLNDIAAPATLSVPKGTIVRITSRIKDFYLDINTRASRVGGAEYYYGKTPVTDPGQGKGIPMTASDGMFDTVDGGWEAINGTLDTSGLSEGTYSIYVRGMDIGKQWSGVQSATLTVLPAMGYINGTVRDNNTKAGISYAKVSTNTSETVNANSTGFYSFYVDAGSYMLTATSDPRYYANSSVTVNVMQDTETSQDIELVEKPKGTITGTVRNA